MNVTPNPSTNSAMKRTLLAYSLLLLALAATAGSPLRAQRYDVLWRSNPWNGGPLRAGLRSDTLSLSYAELYAAKQNGGMTDHSVSDDSFSAGVRTESVRHFRKISFAGKFAYDYADGNNQCGSMMLRPGFWPVGIYEFTPGRKIRETYAFTGGLSVDLSEQWRGALEVDFAAANYAKRKDLRHKNTALDLEAVPSVQWHHGKWSAAAAYLFAKNTERVEAEEVGSTPLSYDAFFDKGLFYGVQSLWTGNGIHLTDTGINALPLKEMTHGAALGIQYGTLFAEAVYRHRSGESGEKGSVWHQFAGNGLQLRLEARFDRGDDSHWLRFRFGREVRQNRETVTVYETTGGVVNASTYGSVPVWAARQIATRLAYEWRRGASGVRAGADYALVRQQSSLLYPELREQALRHWVLWTEGVWAVGRVELTAALSGRWGTHAESARSESSEMVPDSAYPERLGEYAEWHDEYLTATRLGARLGLRVRIVKGFYADASARYEHGFRLCRVPQPNRIEAVLALGYQW